MTKIQTISILFISIWFLVPSCTSKTGGQNHISDAGETKQQPPEYAIAIHGGAGTITPETISKEKQKQYKEKLAEALSVGVDILENGGTAMDAVEATINIMEDCPLFNAGKGAVLTHDGIVELDASFMDGKTMNAGAVAGVRRIKNPISAARKVMTESPHVLLAGEGAVKFAESQNLDIVDNEYFITERRKKSLQKIREKENKHGTVGCVALDKSGNLAAGTSTGGRSNKKFGRIGDSPIIGAGTYANNRTCAISCTGHGEFFIRYVVAYDISALMEYQNMSLDSAAHHVIMEKLQNVDGKGGIIGVDAKGNIAMVFNTPGMFRAYANSTGKKEVLMFD